MKLITIESKSPYDENKMGRAFSEYGIDRAYYNHHDARWEIEEHDEHVDNMIDHIHKMFKEYEISNYTIDTINIRNTALNEVETNDYFYRNIFS